MTGVIHVLYQTDLSIPCLAIHSVLRLRVDEYHSLRFRVAGDFVGVKEEYGSALSAPPHLLYLI